MHEVEVGGARTELASLVPAHFLKRLFVQSEAESEKFGEVSRILHLAVIVIISGLMTEVVKKIPGRGWLYHSAHQDDSSYVRMMAKRPSNHRRWPSKLV